MTHFSSRLSSELAPNALSEAVARRRAAGVPWIDLTESNPTVVGLAYPADVLEPLSDAAGARYTPEPFGLPEARASVAAEFVRRGLDVPPDRIVLTASTSEAYALVFKLLCDPGDRVLVPQPSYPLFDLLTRLEGVVASPYRLDYHGDWSIDRDSVLDSWTPRTRAVLVVSPNNPTGSVLRSADRDWLRTVCVDRGAVLIADEVFAEYPLVPRSDGVSGIGGSPMLACALGGLSKSAGLPQVKLGWIAVDGPERDVRAAMMRLEVIADTYLSVSTPVQIAAGRLIESGRLIRTAIAARLQQNLARLRAAAGSHPAVSVLLPEGGWSVVLRVPATATDEALALALFERAGVLVHPGYFFDFAGEGYLVVSLLPEPATFAAGVDRLLDVVAGDVRS